MFGLFCCLGLLVWFGLVILFDVVFSLGVLVVWVLWVSFVCWLVVFYVILYAVITDCFAAVCVLFGGFGLLVVVLLWLVFWVVGGFDVFVGCSCFLGVLLWGWVFLGGLGCCGFGVWCGFCCVPWVLVF